MDYRIIPLKKNKDERGWLTEILRLDVVEGFQQVYVVTLNPGVERGKHYHMYRREWFFTAKGKGVIKLKDIISGKENNISVDDENHFLIEVGPWVLHTLKNTGDDVMIKVSGTSDMYDKDNPDVYKLE